MEVQARRVPGGIDVRIFYRGKRYGGVVTRKQLSDFLDYGADIPPWLESVTGLLLGTFYLLRNEEYNEEDEDTVEEVLLGDDAMVFRGKLARVLQQV